MTFNPSHAQTLIYICGRYSAPDRAGVQRNIDRAIDLAVDVARLGAMPVCPHSNTGDERFEQAQDYDFWIAGTMALMRACSALILVPGWESSSGARGEVAEAQRLGLPVFTSLEQLAAWLRPSLGPEAGL